MLKFWRAVDWYKNNTPSKPSTLNRNVLAGGVSCITSLYEVLWCLSYMYVLTTKHTYCIILKLERSAERGREGAAQRRVRGAARDEERWGRARANLNVERPTTVSARVWALPAQYACVHKHNITDSIIGSLLPATDYLPQTTIFVRSKYILTAIPR